MKPSLTLTLLGLAGVLTAGLSQQACGSAPASVSQPVDAAAIRTGENAAGPSLDKTMHSVAPIWTPAVVDRSAIDYSRMPLWAWGASEPPKPGQPQAVNGDPSDVRPNRFKSLPAEELHRKRRAAGSRFEWSFAEFRNVNLPGNGAQVVDWFPEDHPNPMPAVVKYGPAALGQGDNYLLTNRACGSCHLADGSGRPENGSPAGLPRGYILRQLRDFRNDRRHDSDPRKANSNTMVMLAKAMTEEEMQQAAAYFSAVRFRPHVRVIETTQVPKTRVAGDLFVPTGEPGSEPIGKRIIEVSEDLEQTQELSSARGTWIAYVPVGAVAKGRELVTGGARRRDGNAVPSQSAACTSCHGASLRGVPPDVPPLAGRSPSYLARELFNIQQSVRLGSYPDVALMRVLLHKFDAEDILNITAYLASLPPAGRPAH